ncbi:uncharacterized protein LOC125071597 [Vanessa atalanta]|uniref:uncharacterized protein LOC125071597 n=1 Tax=Vanessa atalanta TaxID=42275 RepID=UPI001FCDECA3|nr:uncharacterized protein LOC125071597 [Vanessa atalanta]
MDSFDYETFISLVEDREVLWDKTLEIYKDKRKSLKAWFEICHIMNENFADLPDTEKNKYGKLISQKWKNIRDAWMKCDKKIRESKSGSGAKQVHKYQYYDNLQFLKKITPQPTQSGSNMPEENKSEVTNVNKRKKNEELNPVDKKMIKFMETLEKDDDSRMMSFFKGIAPTVERFKDEDIVEFQYQVLNIIRNI